MGIKYYRYNSFGDNLDTSTRFVIAVITSYLLGTFFIKAGLKLRQIEKNSPKFAEARLFLDTKNLVHLSELVDDQSVETNNDGDDVNSNDGDGSDNVTGTGGIEIDGNLSSDNGDNDGDGDENGDGDGDVPKIPQTLQASTNLDTLAVNDEKNKGHHQILTLTQVSEGALDDLIDDLADDLWTGHNDNSMENNQA